MTNIDYRDFYRFLASVGVVMISFALLLPWLFLREPSGLERAGSCDHRQWNRRDRTMSIEC